MNSAQFYSAKDIAHRWFAYFEGETETLDTHLALFSDNIRLVHAGSHVLANNLPSLKAWLKSVPDEISAHFIDTFQFESLDQYSAKITMSVRYQALDHNQRLIGAVIDYQTEVEFDQYNNARFRFIQKTPIHPNPDQRFTPSFNLNRIESLRAHLLYLHHQTRQTTSLESTVNLKAQEPFSQALNALSENQLTTLPILFLDEWNDQDRPATHLSVQHNRQRYLSILNIAIE